MHAGSRNVNYGKACEGQESEDSNKAIQSYYEAEAIYKAEVHEAKKKQCFMLGNEYLSIRATFKGLVERWDVLRGTEEGKIVVVEMAKKKDQVCSI
jgi:hypothetical protein